MSNESTLVKGHETYYRHNWIELTDMTFVLIMQYILKEHLRVRGVLNTYIQTIHYQII